MELGRASLHLTCWSTPGLGLGIMQQVGPKVGVTQPTRTGLGSCLPVWAENGMGQPMKVAGLFLRQHPAAPEQHVRRRLAGLVVGTGCP